MPKGKKICPACKAELGVRVQVCTCSYSFQKKDPPPKSEEKLIPKPEVKLEIQDPKIKATVFGKILTPSGACPIKIKNTGRPATDEEIVDWAFQVMEHNSRYSFEVPIYWLRDIVDINSQEYHRIKGIVLEAINPYGATT
jgi:hypothetical protein